MSKPRKRKHQKDTHGSGVKTGRRVFKKWKMFVERESKRWQDQLFLKKEIAFANVIRSQPF